MPGRGPGSWNLGSGPHSATHRPPLAVSPVITVQEAARFNPRCLGWQPQAELCSPGSLLNLSVSVSSSADQKKDLELFKISAQLGRFEERAGECAFTTCCSAQGAGHWHAGFPPSPPKGAGEPQRSRMASP